MPLRICSRLLASIQHLTKRQTSKTLLLWTMYKMQQLSPNRKTAVLYNRYQYVYLYECEPGHYWLRGFMMYKLKLKASVLQRIWHRRPSLTQTIHFKSQSFSPFLTGTLLVKYDNHKTGCAASSYKCFICFQLAVNTIQTTTTGLIDLTGGPRSLPLAPQWARCIWEAVKCLISPN